MDDDPIGSLLVAARTIAVVGMSDRADRDSYQVGTYLATNGYHVVPVHPGLSEVAGLRAYATLSEIPLTTRIDIVDVFRRSEAVPPIVEEALALPRPPRAIWLQLGIRDDLSAARARAAGLEFYQDRCLMVEHRRRSR